jgi:hypothetical protein
MRQLNAAITAFLRHPRTAATAFYVAIAATVLRLLPLMLQFIGLDGTAVMRWVNIVYELDTLREALSVVVMLATALLWLVLSRMFPKAAQMMRYAAFALAAVMAVSAVWTLTESIFFPPIQPLAQHDTATAISSQVTAILGTANSMLALAVSLLLTVRYRGRLRQLGILVVAQFALSCVSVLAIFALTSLHAGMVWAGIVSGIHFVLQSALSILLPYFQWRAVRGQ